MSASNLIKNPIRFDGSGYLSLDIPACTLYQLWADKVGNYGEYETSSHSGGSYNIGQNRSGILYEFYGVDGDGNEVVRLQWDGIGLPWNAANGKRATLVSGSIRPLYPVTRVEGQRGPGYKIQPGSKISFSDVPAGTLQITKREDGIITTVESDFTGGTLELTTPDLLDAKIVDADGYELFALGKKVGNTVFDALNPTQTGEILGNVEVVEREVCWGLEFDGTGYVDCGSEVNLGDDDFIIYTTLSIKQPQTGTVFGKPHYGYWPELFFTSTSTRLRYGGNYIYTTLTYFMSVSEKVCVCATREGNAGVLYINGREYSRDEDMYQGYSDSSTYNLNIGRRSTGNPYFRGTVFLPFIIIAPTVLNQAMVSRLAQRDFSCIRPENTVLYLDYDPSTNQLVDRSPYNHQITIQGSGIQIKRVML